MARSEGVPPDIRGLRSGAGEPGICACGHRARGIDLAEGAAARNSQPPLLRLHAFIDLAPHALSPLASVSSPDAFLSAPIPASLSLRRPDPAPHALSPLTSVSSPDAFLSAPIPASLSLRRPDPAPPSLTPTSFPIRISLNCPGFARSSMFPAANVRIRGKRSADCRRFARSVAKSRHPERERANRRRFVTGPLPGALAGLENPCSPGSETFPRPVSSGFASSGRDTAVNLRIRNPLLRSC